MEVYGEKGNTELDHGDEAPTREEWHEGSPRCFFFERVPCIAKELPTGLSHAAKNIRCVNDCGASRARIQEIQRGK